MAYMNKVFLMGNLTKDPQTKQTQSGTSVCSFTLAVSRKYTSNGQQQEETCFVDITAFSKTADICSQYLVKGSPAMIEGRLKLDQWQDKQTGDNRQKLSVLAENVQLLGRREDNGNQNDNGGYQQQQPQQQSRTVPPQYNPANNPPPMPEVPEDNWNASDDIPF